MSEGNNLLVRLHRWVNRQDENFTTESLVHLLRFLLNHEPQAGVRLLKRVTGNAIDITQERAKSVQVTTQVTVAEGRPDVQIRTTDHLVYVEAKVQSGLGWRQLERYRRELRASGIDNTSLILLTRYPVEIPAGGEIPDAFVRWFLIADSLGDTLNSSAMFNAASRHLVEQFIGFLSARGMTMEQVGWEMIRGMQAMRAFTVMLGEAASASGISVKSGNGSDYTGYYLAGNRYWIGISHDEPQYLYLHTYQVAIDLKKVAELGEGETRKSKWSPEGWQWLDWIDLESEDVHFFARSRASQLQYLEKFIRDTLTLAHQIEMSSPPDSTPSAAVLETETKE